MQDLVRGLLGDHTRRGTAGDPYLGERSRDLFRRSNSADQLGSLAGIQQQAAACLTHTQNAAQTLGAMTVRILDEQQAPSGERLPDLIFNALKHNLGE